MQNAKALKSSARATSATATKTDGIPLPVEVWQLIMDWFVLDLTQTRDGDTGLREMASFSRTCWTFCSLARPILYSYVDLSKEARNRDRLLSAMTSSLSTWNAAAHISFLHMDIHNDDELRHLSSFAAVAPLNTLLVSRQSEEAYAEEEVALWMKVAQHLGSRATLKHLCVGKLADQGDANDIVSRLLSIPTLRNASLATCKLTGMAERDRLGLSKIDLSHLVELYLTGQCALEDVAFDGLRSVTARYTDDDVVPGVFDIKARNLKEMVIGTDGVLFWLELVPRVNDRAWMPLLTCLQIDFFHTMHNPPTEDDSALLAVMGMVAASLCTQAQAAGREGLIVQCCMRERKRAEALYGHLDEDGEQQEAAEEDEGSN